MVARAQAEYGYRKPPQRMALFKRFKQILADVDAFTSKMAIKSHDAHQVLRINSDRYLVIKVRFSIIQHKNTSLDCFKHTLSFYSIIAYAFCQ